MNKKIKYRSPQKWRQYKITCEEIWRERGGKCEDCGRQLTTPRKHNFHHLKDRRKNLCNKDTLKLLCFICHRAREGIKETQNWLDN